MLEQKAREQQDKAKSHFTIFGGSTVVRSDLIINTSLPGMLQNHMATWRLVYQLETLHDWLFRQ